VPFKNHSALNDSITFDTFYSRLNKKPKSKIAVALLDQNLISGIGNYLRCDILWYAKINGDTRIGELTTSQKTDLYNASRNICRYYADLSYELDFTPEDYERDFLFIWKKMIFMVIKYL
jgi:formamidopyrimidine-DNA glycosylase